MIGSGGGGYSTSVERAFKLADARSERLAAVIRIAIFAAIIVSVVAAQSTGFDHRPLEAAGAIYGAGTLAGLAIAWRGFYRAWLPYVFVGFDVLTLAITILMLGRTLGLPPGLWVALPVASLVIIVLVHASMHYRPALVMYGAVLFAAATAVGSILLGAGEAGSPTAVRDLAEHHLLHFSIFPIAVFVLAVAILLVTTHRTRRFIEDAVGHAHRAATLSRYFAPEVAEELTRRTPGDVSFGERMQIAVVFADLRGFTAMAEAMDPAELARFLSDFRSRIAAPVLAQGGVVDKYMGDAIMAVFGAPTPRADDAKRALACAHAMVDAVDIWSMERKRQGKPPVAIAIGGHYGYAFAGVLSDGRLLEYTVIGDTVNVASRIARLPRQFDTPLIVSAAFMEAAGGGIRAGSWERLPAQALPGLTREIVLFALRAGGTLTSSPST